MYVIACDTYRNTDRNDEV